MNDKDHQVQELVVIMIEQERARLAEEVELLRSMMLFDWRCDTENNNELFIQLESILPIKAGRLLHGYNGRDKRHMFVDMPALFTFNIEFDMGKIVDNNVIRYTYTDIDASDFVLCVRNENNYAQIVVCNAPDIGADFVCVMIKERADALIELIDSKLVLK